MRNVLTYCFQYENGRVPESSFSRLFWRSRVEMGVGEVRCTGWGKIFSLPPCYKDDKVFGRYGSGWIGAGGCRFLNGLGMCEGAFSNGV